MFPLQIVAIVCYMLISVVTILANFVVLTTILLTKKLRTASNTFLISLAVADISVGMVTLPMRTSEVFKASWTLRIDYCTFSHCFTLMTLTASILNLVVISVDRYIAIGHPYTYVKLQIYMWHFVIFSISLAWMVAILISFLPLYGWGSNGKVGRRYKGGICKFNETVTQEYIFTVLLGIVGTSILIVFFIYYKIYIIVKNHITRITPLSVPSQATDTAFSSEVYSSSRTASLLNPTNGTLQVPAFQSRANSITSENNFGSSIMRNEKSVTKYVKHKKAFLKSWKSAKTMFFVILCFFVAWTAFIVPTSIFLKCPSCANSAVVLISTIVLFSGSAVNPFIYFSKIKLFREETKKLFAKLCWKIKV